MAWVLRQLGLPLAGLIALTSAILLYESRGYRTPAAAGFVPVVAPASSSVAPTTQPAPPVVKHRPARSTGAAPPNSLTIADLGVVNARIIAVSAHDGNLDVPANPQVLGWWSGGALPGARSGSVVIDGHVDSARLGRGALFHLGSVPMGSRVLLTTSNGRRVSYRVVGRRVYDKRSLPADVFATGGPPRLVLITCGGPFNKATRHYRDNVVVYAVPAIASR